MIVNVTAIKPLIFHRQSSGGVYGWNKIDHTSSTSTYIS